ncbi:MAG: RNA polymerase sigma factor [Singulisphaera sp.]
MPEAPTGDSTPDETLVALAREGDRPAREELFRRHWGVAYRVAYRLLGHEHDAHDAVQEGLLKANVHLDDFDGRSGFRTWLLKIVTNAALDSGRKRKRRPTLGLGDGEGNGPEPAHEEDPAHGLLRKDLRRALEVALNRLTPATRTTFVLFAEAGLSYKEISDALDVPIGTVMSRLHYARHKLQSYLEGIEGL